VAGSTLCSPRRWIASRAIRPTWRPLFKHLRFAGVQIVTLAEGEIFEVHVCLKGTMNALFLKDLPPRPIVVCAGRVEKGKAAGGLCYGCKVVKRTQAKASRFGANARSMRRRRSSSAASSGSSQRENRRGR